MSNDDKIFELMEKFYGEFSEFKQDMNEFKQDMNEFKQETKEELKGIKKTVVNIENDHGNKLKALFDGQKQNAEKLDRIEAEVIKHEEFILKRIK
jgi:Sec-independent protein translocase protein TatA